MPFEVEFSKVESFDRLDLVFPVPILTSLAGDEFEKKIFEKFFFDRVSRVVIG